MKIPVCEKAIDYFIQFVTVYLSTTTAGMDYVDISQVVDTISLTITPSPGRWKRSDSLLTQCVNLSLLADSILENDESFIVSLGSTDSSVVVDTSPLIVTILDNDCKHFIVS